MKKNFFTSRLTIELILLLILLFMLIFKIRFLFIPYPRHLKTAGDYHLLAKALITGGSYLKAEEAAKKALGLDNKFAKAYIDLGKIYADTGNYIKAQKSFLQALEYIGNDKSNQEIIYYNLGVIYEREKNLEKSWVYYQKAYQMKSYLKGPEFWNENPSQVVSYVMKNDKDGFSKKVQSITELPPEIYLVEKKFQRYIYKYNFKRLIKECQQYLADNPNSQYTYLFLEYLASALSRMGKYAESLEQLRKIENLNPSAKDASWVKYTQAYNLWRLKKYDSALTYLHEIIKKYHNTEFQKKVYFLIWRILTEAKNNISFSFLSKPDLPEDYLAWVKHLLSQIYYRNNDYERALEYVNSILTYYKSYKYSDKVLLLSAQIYEKKENLEKEESVLQEYIVRYPKRWHTSFVHFRLATIYQEKGDYLQSYLEYVKSGILGIVLIIDFLIILLICGTIIAVFFMISRIFFRKKWQEPEINLFRLKDLYTVFVFLFALPSAILLIILSLNYFFNNLFNLLHLNPVVISLLLSDFLLMGLCLFFLKRKYGIDNLNLGFVSRGYKFNILLPVALTIGGIGVGFLFFVLLQVLGVKVPSSTLERLTQDILLKGDSFKIFSLLFMVTITGPITEEIIFRVFLLNFFKRYFNLTFAVIFSAIFFAFFHQSFILLAYFFFIGVILAIIYLKTKTIIPCMLTHALYNFILMIFMILVVTV